MRAGWVWTDDPNGVVVITYRRGPHAKGRARLRGRRMFWFIVSALGAHFLRS